MATPSARHLRRLAGVLGQRVFIGDECRGEGFPLVEAGGAYGGWNPRRDAIAAIVESTRTLAHELAHVLALGPFGDYVDIIEEYREQRPYHELLAEATSVYAVGLTDDAISYLDGWYENPYRTEIDFDRLQGLVAIYGEHIRAAALLEA